MFNEKVNFNATESIYGKIIDGAPNKVEGGGKNVNEVQCFPLYSILLAVGRTSIDFFSLDVEGHELKVFFNFIIHQMLIKFSIFLYSFRFSRRSRGTKLTLK